MITSEQLKKEAIGFGLCKEWTDGWGEPTRQGLLEKFVKGIDFCIKNNFPSVEQFDNIWTKEEMHSGGVWCNDIVTERTNIMVLNGHCTGEIECDGYSVTTVYVRHESDVTITAKDNAIVFVRLFDNASATINNYSEKKVVAYTYSDEYGLCINGDVIIRERDFDKVYK